MRKTYKQPIDADASDAQPPPGARRNPEPATQPQTQSKSGGVLSAVKWIFVIGASAVVGHLAVEKFKSWRRRDDPDGDDDVPELNPARAHAPQLAPPQANILPFPMPTPMPWPMPTFSEPPARNRRRRDDDDDDSIAELIEETRKLKKEKTALEKENRKMAKILEAFDEED